MSEMKLETPANTLEGNKGEPKTFTQDDVNRIVQERLAKDRAKASEELDKREKELKDKEFRLNSRQKVLERGLPESIIDALNCSNEEAFDKALNMIDGLLKERTPSAEQTEMEKVKARFTTPMNTKTVPGDDPIRKAMNM